jgi:hypothetical protein
MFFADAPFCAMVVLPAGNPNTSGPRLDKFRTGPLELLVGVWEETRKTVLYVTHNVAEAVYLADRIIVLSPHPGTVRAQTRITLPRPPDPLSVAFLDSRRRSSPSSVRDADRGRADRYLIACGLIGEPVPRVITRGGAQKKNS